MTSTINVYPDDFVKIKGQKDDGSLTFWFGQINSKDKTTFKCCLLEKQPNGTLVFDGTEHTFDLATIDDYANLSDYTSHEKAWKALGLRMLRSTSPFTFVELDKEEQLGLHDLGDDEESENEDNEDNESLGSLRDFIASEDEAWTPADPNAPELRPGAAAVVADIHDAVHEYNEWVPANSVEQGARRFIDRQWVQAVHADADLHFVKGKVEPDYAHPPRKKRRKTSNE